MQDIEYPYNAFVADVFEADEFAQALLDHLRNHPEESKKAPAILDQLHTNFGLDEGTYRRLKLEVESIRTAYLALNRLQDAARTAESDNGFVITAFGPQPKPTAEKKSTRSKTASASKAKTTSSRSPQAITAHPTNSPKTTTKRTRTTPSVGAPTPPPVIKNQQAKTTKSSSPENLMTQEGISAMAVEVENEVPAPAEQARQRLSAMAQRGEFNSSNTIQSARVAPPRISARREEIDLLPKNSSIPRKMIWAVVGMVPVAGLVWLTMSYTKVNPDLVMPGDAIANLEEKNSEPNTTAFTKPNDLTQSNAQQTDAQQSSATENTSTTTGSSATGSSAALTSAAAEKNSSDEKLLTPVPSNTASSSNKVTENNTLANSNSLVENSVSSQIPARPLTNTEQVIAPVSERTNVQTTNTTQDASSRTENVAANSTAESSSTPLKSQSISPQQTPSESTSTSQPVEPTWSNPAVIAGNTTTQNASPQKADVIFKELSQQAQDLYIEDAEGQGQTALSLLAQLEQANAKPDQLRDGYTLVARGYEALSKIYHAQGERTLSNRYDQQAVLFWRKIQSLPAATSQTPSTPKKPVVEDYSL